MCLLCHLAPHVSILTDQWHACCLQTVKSKFTKDAKTTTREEFEDNVRMFWTVAKGVIARFGPLQAYVSWDNNKIQKTANLDRMGVLPHEKLPLAEYMPDGHKIIEHFFARLKGKVMEEVYKRATDLTPGSAQQLVLDAFFHSSTKAIYKDVLSLPLTYRVIATPKGSQFLDAKGRVHTGSGGDWPAKACR